MALGPGKYDAVTTLVRETTGALGAVVLVFDGILGDGFEVQVPATMMPLLPKMLREMADEIERTG